MVEDLECRSVKSVQQFMREIADQGDVYYDSGLCFLYRVFAEFIAQCQYDGYVIREAQLQGKTNLRFFSPCDPHCSLMPTASPPG